MWDSEGNLIYWFQTIRPYVGKDLNFDLYPGIGFRTRDASGVITDDWVGWTAPGLSCPERELEDGDAPWYPTDRDCAWIGINYGGAVGLNTAPSIYELDLKTFLFTDTRSYYVLSPLISPLTRDPLGDGQNTTGGSYGGPYPNSGWQFIYNCIRPRHTSGDSFSGSLEERGLNFALADGHVEYKTFRQWLDNDAGLWGTKFPP